MSRMNQNSVVMYSLHSPNHSQDSDYIFMLTKRVKSKIITEHRTHEKDTGSAPVQIAMLTRRIDELAAHLKKNPKDNHSRRGLLGVVSQRRRLLEYLKKHDVAGHARITKKLELKK